MDNVENGQLKDEPLSLMYMISLSPPTLGSPTAQARVLGGLPQDPK